MKTVTFDEARILEDYNLASNEVKRYMETLFGKEMFENKPTLDDYKTICTYEDACIALGRDALRVDSTNGDTATVLTNGGNKVDIPSHIVALMKLETISRALWGKNFQPNLKEEKGRWYWYPWLTLWTKEEIKGLNVKQRSSLLSVYTDNNAYMGFGCLTAHYRCSNEDAYIGLRLCQETEEKARYFGQQFIELWLEYLEFNF